MSPEAINDNTPENNNSLQKKGGEILGDIAKQADSPEVREQKQITLSGFGKIFPSYFLDHGELVCYLEETRQTANDNVVIKKAA